ncbi:TetR family transcriptional regulator C-terminal domain-containing protein [Nocardioides dubius]|uniref:ABC-F family ATP-binding cassette domain-containing protein n=1 Tax=Nocardioides dubius TaxID=317019 RepID=A0ABN1U0I9_9ACTN
MARPPSDRRTLLLDTAITVIADHGLRGLTHRAVDRAADLPEGSTSAYYRTRRALQLAVALRTTELLRADVNELAESILTLEGESEASTAAVSALFDSWLRERSLLLARIELTIEAARDPELAQPLIEERARMVELITHVITEICVDDAETRAAAVISALDGVLIGGLLHADEAQRTAFLTNSVGLILNEVAGASTLH